MISSGRPQVQFSKNFIKDFAKLPATAKGRFEKQLNLLLENPRHPSLRLKKMAGQQIDIWEARISRSMRFTFHVEGNTYILRRIGTHDILQNP